MATMAEVLDGTLQALLTDLEGYARDRDSRIKTQVRKNRLALATQIREDVARWRTELKMVKHLAKAHQLGHVRRISTELQTHFDTNRGYNDHETGKLAGILKARRDEVEKLLGDETAFSVQSAFAKNLLKKKAARSAPQEQLNVAAAYQKLTQGGLFSQSGLTFEQQSLANRDALAVALKGTPADLTQGLSVQERRVYDFLQGARFRLTHATNNEKKILGGKGALLSNVQLLKAIPGLNTNTYQIDRELFSNDDFVFFTFDLHAKHDNQYGDVAFVLDADEMRFFEHGWVSYIDFLAPGVFLDEVREKALLPLVASDDVVRRCKSTKDETYKGTPYNAEYEFLYPPTNRTRKLTLPELVLHGPHIRTGLALSVLLELRYMSLTPYLAGLNDHQLAELVGKALNTLYWLEAKLPADLYVRFMRPAAGAPEQRSHGVWNKKFFNDG